MKTYLLTPLIAIGLLVLARLSFYTVDAAEYAYVTVLGEHRATYDGADADGAGLKFGWPWPILQVQRLDRRLQQFDLPAVELLIHDPKGKTIPLLLEVYVCWKIPDDRSVDLFVRRIGSARRAEGILGPLVNGQLGAEIGQMRMDELVNVPRPGEAAAPVDVGMEKLRKRLLDAIAKQVRDDYGVEVVDIRLRRFNHPQSVQESIFNRIRSERAKIVSDYQSEGELQASKIGSAAEEKVRKMLAEARSKEEEIKAEADIAANKIRNDAYSQDPEFYAFLKRLEKMQSILGDSKSMLLLSTHRTMFESIFQPPRPVADAPKDRKGEK